MPQTTQDRFLKSRGVIRGSYASTLDMDINRIGITNSDKYFCSQGCYNQFG